LLTRASRRALKRVLGGRLCAVKMTWSRSVALRALAVGSIGARAYLLSPTRDGGIVFLLANPD